MAATLVADADADTRSGDGHAWARTVIAEVNRRAIVVRGDRRRVLDRRHIGDRRTVIGWPVKIRIVGIGRRHKNGAVDLLVIARRDCPRAVAPINRILYRIG